MLITVSSNKFPFFRFLNKLLFTGTAFTVIWENMPLQNEVNETLLRFTFSVTLYKSGDITFAYRDIPVPIDLVTQDKRNTLKIGVADAYIIDKKIECK